MGRKFEDLTVVIPCLNPPWNLVGYVKTLGIQGFSHIVLVNDGSQSVYGPIFRSLSAMDHCVVLTHGENQGKGAALKTAYDYIDRTMPQCKGILTVDADGQHTIGDVCNIGRELLGRPRTLLLGGRNFSSGAAPIKSYLGNRVSSMLFYLIHGTWVSDTQTGLRGFDTCFLPDMMAIPGTGFEYETAVLTTFAEKNLPIFMVSIETIYLAGNETSHFKPLRDSIAIGRVFFSKPWRFFLSAGLSCLVDVGLCLVLLSLLKGIVGNHLLRIALAVITARVCSLGLNYTVNKTYVFCKKGKESFYRYLLLAGANLVTAIFLIYLGRRALGLDEGVAKILVDIGLFFVNYHVQRRWVFPMSERGRAV